MSNGRHAPRKEKLWAGLPGIELSLTAAGTSLGGSLAFNTRDTVMRMIGEYTIGADPASLPSIADSVFITVALARVSSDAFAAGAGSVPDPAEEPEYPWLYWKAHHLEFPTAGANTSTFVGSVRQAFDVRTMRKFSPRESLAWIVQYVDGAGTPPVIVGIAQSRVLIGLS